MSPRGGRKSVANSENRRPDGRVLGETETCRSYWRSLRSILAHSHPFSREPRTGFGPSFDAPAARTVAHLGAKPVARLAMRWPVCKNAGDAARRGARSSGRASVLATARTVRAAQSVPIMRQFVASNPQCVHSRARRCARLAVCGLRHGVLERGASALRRLRAAALGHAPRDAAGACTRSLPM